MLFFVLVSFISIVKIMTNHAMIQMQSEFEQAHRRGVERFSLMESYVLTQTIKQFHAYENEKLCFEFHEGVVIVSFIDESAYLFFDFEKPVYSRLDYDLVFDSALNYTYIDESEYLLIDKKLD